MIWAVSYSSNLTAFLTVTKEQAPMDTIGELYESTIPVGGMSSFYNRSMASSNDFRIKVHVYSQ